MSEGIKKEHPSYGIISISRIGSNKPIVLFGSNIKHQNTIRIQLKNAAIERKYNKDFIYDTKTLFEVEMSESQFAQMITSLNIGVGTPVTIRYIQEEKIPNPPIDESIVEKASADFNNRLKSINNRLLGLLDNIEVLILQKKQLTKADKEEIKSEIVRLQNDFAGNMTFMVQCFEGSIDTTINQAKTEFEAHVSNVIHKLGNEQIQDKMKEGIPIIEFKPQ